MGIVEMDNLYSANGEGSYLRAQFDDPNETAVMAARWESGRYSLVSHSYDDETGRLGDRMETVRV